MKLDALLRRALVEAEAADLLRVPVVYEASGAHVSDGATDLVSFASNDYLGLASHPRLRQALADGALRHAGGRSSRVVAGTSPAHREAERSLAEQVGLPDARLFPSAYAGNLSVLGSLFGPDDVLFSDALNHASLIDGCRLSRAQVVVYRHRDLDHLTHLLAVHPARRVTAVITESLFSMDGDLADLPALRRLTERHDATLVVDEAHALGVVGPSGACAAASVVPDVLVGGLGKAFGLAGGFVAGSRELGRAIDNFGRTFVFSTAILPAIAAAVPDAVQLVQDARPERERLARHVRVLRTAARRSGVVIPDGPGAILPWILGEPARAIAASASLRAQGFLVPAMRPPTVPAGTARLRITPTALHTEAEIEHLAEALAALTTPRR